MSGLLIAFGLWLLFRGLESGQRRELRPCRLCWEQVYWDGHTFLHQDGTERRPFSPPIWLDPLDESKGQMLHAALPVGR